MIQTLASMALDAGHDIFAPEKRFTNVAKESDIWCGLMGYSPTDVGISVNENNALTYMPWLSGTRVVSETWASMPLKVFLDSDSGPKVARKHYLYPILHDVANPEMTSFSFWEAAGVSLCMWNNFYAEIEWNGAGRVKALWPLLPNRVTVRRVAGKLVYDYANEQGEKPTTLPFDSVLHIPGCLNINNAVAQSLVTYAREAIGLGLAPQKYAANFYKNNARPGMYLTTSQSLSPDQRKAIASAWNDVHSGIQGAGKTGVLEGGLELKTPSVNQKDAEFSITRDHQLLEVCRALRIPPHMMADLSRATFSNIEHQDIAFAKHTMTPYCRRAEQVLNMKLIGIGSGYYAEFLMDGLMRGDLLSRTQAAATAVQNGLLMPNEGRAWENRPQAEGGDQLLIQGATVPLSMAGKHLQGSEPAKGAESNED